MTLVDTHAHLAAPEFDDDREAVIERAREAGVSSIVVVGFDLPTSRQAVALAERHAGLVAAIGVHPNDAHHLGTAEKAALAAMAANPVVVAIGETGLDFYRNRAPREVQLEAFRWHLELARERRLPVIVHDREAHAEALAVLQQRAAGDQLCGVMHCFSGNEEFMESVLALGMHISLGGPVTYPNARGLLEIAQRVPLDRLLLETDCPWLAPVPHRGQRNESAYVQFVARRVAERRGLSEGEIGATTSSNARALFGITGRLAGASRTRRAQGQQGSADAITE